MENNTEISGIPPAASIKKEETIDHAASCSGADVAIKKSLKRPKIRVKRPVDSAEAQRIKSKNQDSNLTDKAGTSADAQRKKSKNQDSNLIDKAGTSAEKKCLYDFQSAEKKCRTSTNPAANNDDKTGAFSLSYPENQNFEMVSTASGIDFSYKGDSASASFFTLLEKDIRPMPEFVKNILYACGISSPLVFLKYDINQMILDMEKFIKEDTVLRNSIPRTQDFFHIFYQNPNEFRFMPGHLAILKLAQTAIEKKIDFYNKSLVLEVRTPKIGEKRQPAENRQLAENRQPAEKKEKLEENVQKQKLKNLVDQWLRHSTKGANPDLFAVSMTGEGNNLYGLVKCGFCGYKQKVYWQKNNKKYRWVLSNLYTHFHKYHQSEMLLAEEDNAPGVPKQQNQSSSNQPNMDSFFKPI